MIIFRKSRFVIPTSRVLLHPQLIILSCTHYSAIPHPTLSRLCVFVLIVAINIESHR